MKRNGQIAGLALALAIVACLAPVGVQAGGEKGALEIGGYAGYGFPDDYELPNGTEPNPQEDVLWGGRIGYWTSPSWNFEVSYQELTTETETTAFPNFEFDIWSVRFNGLYNFRAEKAFRPFLTLGAGLETLDTPTGVSHDPGLNGGLGARWFIGDHFNIRGDARWVVIDIEDFLHSKQYNFEGTLGLGFLFGGGPAPDEDGDGVSDRKDKCPGTPRGAVVDEKGCPKDADGDGVFDGIDKCPDTPKGWAVDAAGCPKDSDGDGVNDAMDKCPNTPAGATVDASGCPSDEDGDGVYDGIDKCPATPKGATVDATGCPKDSDGDGVWDGIDKCPNTPRGTKVDAAGCPPPAPPPPPPPPPMLPEPKKPLVLEGVNFDHDSATLRPESSMVLDKVATSMRDYPDVRIQVQGHTDSTGSEAYNLKLSQRRADAVMAYLVSKGVAQSRLSAKGVGESNPIADNKTTEGKAKNRRVELHRTE